MLLSLIRLNIFASIHVGSIMAAVGMSRYPSSKLKVGGLVLSDEKRLIKRLLEQYETVGIVGRPVYNTSETIQVFYGLALIQILDLDEKNQVLTTNVWSRYTWTDILLAWNATEFGGIEQVRVPVAKIWTPDIVLYNYADTRLKEHRETMAVVSNNGKVLWIPPAIFRSTCAIDITHFPFDEQICFLKFGSWTYDGFKLDIMFYEDVASMDVNDYVPSNEWALVDHPARKNTRYYPCCSDLPYPDLTFTVRLKRVAIFYNYILILPCVLLSFLTLVIFWLPPESPAKMMLGMNIFVAFFVLLILLAENTPPAATSIPLIGGYFCMNMILITLSTFLAVIVIQTHIRTDRTNKVPIWLKKLTIDSLAHVLCMGEFLEPQSRYTRNINKLDTSKSVGATSIDPVHEDSCLHDGKHKSAHNNARTNALKRKMMMMTTTTTTTTTTHNNANNTLSTSHRLPHHGLIDMWNHDKHLATAAISVTQPGGCCYAGHANSCVTEQPSRTDATTATTSNGCCNRCPECETLGHHRCNNADDGDEEVDDHEVENDIKEIKKILRCYMARLGDKDAHSRVTKEWRIVARVLDRLFFFMYVSTIIVSLATIFPKGAN